MDKKPHGTLLKIATTDPGFLDSFKSWGHSLFDGRTGTSIKPFKQMMNSQGMKDTRDSWNAFTRKGRGFINSLSDNQEGTTWPALQQMFTGEGAPWAWGTAAATAVTMANAFNSGNSNQRGSGGGGSLGLGNVVPWLALGGLAYGAYKLMPKIRQWANSYNSAMTLKNGTTDEKQAVMQNFSENPAQRAQAEKLIEIGGTATQLNTFRQNAKVAPIAQLGNMGLSADQHVWYLPNSMVNRGYVEQTNAPKVWNASNAAYNRLNNLGYMTPRINTSAALTGETLAGWDSKNLDNRGLEELALLGTLKLTPAAYNKQYRAIVDRYNVRRNGGRRSNTNPETGNNVNLTSRTINRPHNLKFNPANPENFGTNYKGRPGIL